jgi:hypothetical protein
MAKRVKKVDLRRIFMNLQKQMIAKLSANREILRHPGTKGDSTELNWVKMLAVYLPKRYKVDKAFVLDSKGGLSEQIDLVIYDQQYSPFLFNQDGALYIPAESVYAVFEIKQTLNKENILYAGKKAQTVRRLKRTTASIPHAGGIFNPKKHFKIISGMLCLESDLSSPFGAVFKDALKCLNVSQRINLGCVLKRGAFEISYGKSIVIKKSEDYDALIFFFLRLLTSLQRLGTVPAMDISQYEKVLQ